MPFTINREEIEGGFAQIEDTKNELEWQINQLKPLLIKASDELSTDHYEPLQILIDLESALKNLEIFKEWLELYEEDFKQMWIDSALDAKNIERLG